MFVMFAQPLTTLIRPRNALGNTCIKRKRTNAFLLMIETTNKDIKYIIEAIDQESSSHN
jgi:hypothetical protein